MPRGSPNSVSRTATAGCCVWARQPSSSKHRRAKCPAVARWNRRNYTPGFRNEGEPKTHRDLFSGRAIANHLTKEKVEP